MPTAAGILILRDVKSRRLLTVLLLAWTLGLGFVQAGVQPVWTVRLVPVCADCDGGCPAATAPVAPEDCVAVCLAWCAAPGFHAVSETESAAGGPDAPGRLSHAVDLHGVVRSLRPLLPPPRG